MPEFLGVSRNWLPLSPRLIGNRKVWTENDWNPITWEEGVTGNQSAAYRASKTWAEKAAWDFMEKSKPHFDLIALNAPGVFG
jgi:nucleoside-diphosphate-sugar epimerase